MSCSQCQRSDLLQPSGGGFVCSSCETKTEVRCRGGHALHPNSSGKLPKHCPECDCLVDAEVSEPARMGCGQCQCGGVLQPSGVTFVCSQCHTEAEIQCQGAHTLRPNSLGKLPKHCPECDCSVDIDSIKILVKPQKAPDTGLRAPSSFDNSIPRFVLGSGDTSATVAPEENESKRKEKDGSAPESAATAVSVDVNSRQHCGGHNCHRDSSIGTAQTDSICSVQGPITCDKGDSSLPVGPPVNRLPVVSHSGSDSSDEDDGNCEDEGGPLGKSGSQSEDQPARAGSSGYNEGTSVDTTSLPKQTTGRRQKKKAKRNAKRQAEREKKNDKILAKPNLGPGPDMSSKTSMKAETMKPSTHEKSVPDAQAGSSTPETSLTNAQVEPNTTGKPATNAQDDVTILQESATNTQETTSAAETAVDGSGLPKGNPRRPSEHDDVTIKFYVAIPKSFGFDKRTDAAYIQFFNGGPQLEASKYELTTTRLISGRNGWTATVHIQRNLLAQEAVPLEYKYFVTRKGKKQTYECIYQKNDTKKPVYRKLRVPVKDGKSKNSYDQYDLVMLPEKYPKEKKNVLKKIWNFLTRSSDETLRQLTDDSFYGLTCMLPDVRHFLNATESQADDIAKTFNNIIDSIKSSDLFFLAENQRNTSQLLLEEAVGHAIADQLQCLKKSSATSRDRNHPDTVDCIVYVAVLIQLLRPLLVSDTASKRDITALAEKALACLEWNGVRLDLLESKLKQRFGNFDEVHSSVRLLVQRSANAGNTAWQQAIPLYHMLGQLSGQQRGPDPASCDNRNVLFWGIDTELQKSIETFKRATREFDATPSLDLLNGTFNQCWLSARTFIASLSEKSLLSTLELQSTLHQDGRLPLPLDGCVAAVLHHYVYVQDSSRKLVEDYATAMKILCKLTERALLYVNEEEKRGRLVREMTVASCILKRDLSGILSKVDVSHWGNVKLTIQLLSELSHLQIRDAGNGTAAQKTAVQSAADGLGLWLNHKQNFLCGFPKADELKMWEDFSAISWHEQADQGRWDKEVMTLINKRVQVMSDEDKVSVYCEATFADSRIEEIFATAAFQAAESVMKSSADIAPKLHSGSLKKFGSLFSFAFNKFWKPAWTDVEKMKFMLTWPQFPRYITLACDQQSQVLDQSCSDKVVECISLMDSFSYILKGGEIKYCDLKFLLDHKDSFVRVFGLLQDKKQFHPGTSASDITDWLKLRSNEKLQFDDLSSNLKIFASLCESSQSEELHGLRRQLAADVSQQPISCLWAPGTACSNRRSQELDCSHFPLTRTCLSATLLNDIKGVHSSITFCCFWKAEYKRCLESRERTEEEKDGWPESDVEIIVKKVWPCAHRQYAEVAARFGRCSATFRDADGLLECCNGREGAEVELILLLGPDKAQRAIEALRKYCDLRVCYDAADLILEMKEALGLTGDFDALKFIAQAKSDKTRSLSHISPPLVKACSRLREVQSPVKIECLRAFLDCKSLVDWVKQHISELRELKVFVDLASIAAGEGDIEVEKVLCLQSSITGYASLIYELQESADLNDFFAKCAPVWKSLETNPALARQLHDTHTNLEWVKRVKDSYGSVEVTSLAQATAINEKGVYQVGFLSTGKLLHKQTLVDVISVTVLDQVECCDSKKEACQLQVSSSRSNATYNYSQLCELQSKLMLVAGKAEQDNPQVAAFVNMLTNVTRLATAYINMCNSGSMLFDKWRAELFCKDGGQQKVSVLVHFELSKTVLRGPRDLDSADHASQLADFMEACLQDWSERISLNRKSFSELNYFTTAQIVFLRKELATFLRTNACDDKVYSMLAMLQACNERDLKAALTNAALVMNERTRPTDGNSSPCGPVQSGASVYTLTVGSQRAAESLVDFGVSKELALAAVQTHSDKSFTGLLKWCQDQSEDVMPCESGCLVNQLAANRATSAPVTKPSTLTEFLDNSKASLESMKGSLRRQLENLWQSYLQKAAKSMRDFLSVEHLGHALRCLVATKGCSRPKRNLPVGIDRRRPHLIVCPQDKVLATALSLYLVDADYPMPTRNEVLVCTEITSKEEVELFFERALTDEHSIYCLVHGHRLGYDTCSYVEEKIEELSLSQKGCCIVVICAQEYDNRSRIVAAMDRFRTRSFHAERLERLRSYVLKNLSSSQERQPQSAASLDFEGSCTRLVCSERAGVGKTLFVHRAVKRLEQAAGRPLPSPLITIQLVEQAADSDKVVSRLLDLSQGQPRRQGSHIVHINISQEVCSGVDELLFNLLILGSLCQGSRYIWQRSLEDYYMIEAVTPRTMTVQNAAVKSNNTLHPVLELLPSIHCFSPQECHAYYRNMQQHGTRKADNHVLMDEGEFKSNSWQRTFRYLSRLDEHRALATVKPRRVKGSAYKMLSVLLRYCGLADPSWSELKHFVLFLDRQLSDCEKSEFCGVAAASDLPGFFEFVIHFMLQMSRDFATRSLYISEEPGYAHRTESQNEPQPLHAMQMKRHWESSPHPYLFFNPDRHTITFLGFCVDSLSGNIVDAQTRRILQEKAVPPGLFQALVHNGVDLSEDFETKQRAEKIRKMCAVMGNSRPGDPDQSYELTMDNVKKILAIHMRFRCGIPVVIMGETGCGKTRLIRFMCDLQVPAGMKLTNLVLMKIHGGVTTEHVKAKVTEAYELAKSNRERCPHVDTVLFLDEANTTDAIGLIKEVMCDNSLDGQPLDTSVGLRIIAAVNPYRKHPDDMIKKLESAGLGYHVKADKTTNRLGTIPMRQLVYRVRALPSSMLPLVWDFGQLSPDVEKKYIVQMILKHFKGRRVQSHANKSKAVATVLVKCQQFMRTQKDECSFVSLRDIDRVLLVMQWFYEKSAFLYRHDPHFCADGEPIHRDDARLDTLTWSLVLALGVCYLARLQPKKRQAFRQAISPYFIYPLELPGGDRQIMEEIELCQSLVINALRDHIDKNIAHNQALKENVFMMVVCVELRIPLFLVGKPGSSKSLAKSIVASAMQGDTARSALFKHLKQTHLASFQCSPQATPEGIVATFKQCARFQKSRDLNKFVSVVVLDEIGLAEDSKLMPLKTLHPLLEDGCCGDEAPEPHMKCAFIGISNWALDPAKMNRGILVQRGIPDKQDLEESARGICESTGHGSVAMDPIITDLAAAYLDVFKEVGKQREFFGLRDFYSLMKMVAEFARTNRGLPHPYELQHAVLRNFGGLDDCNVMEHFKKQLGKHMDTSKIPYTTDYPPCDAIGLIDSSLSGRYTKAGSESRYLLILTENYTALNLIQSKVQKLRPQIIFGSKFPKDLEYTQVCLNINRIKVCMETGTPVMLLNLESLYESLYDALNQYYVYFGGKRFVDLGLGTHRVKCRVHEDFRLIVVALKDVVYEEFPIPLKNRLEKHYVTMSTVLSNQQKDIVTKLEKWAADFVKTRTQRMSHTMRSAGNLSPADAFVGYTTDTAATIVLQVSDGLPEIYLQDRSEEILEKAKYKLLLLASPDAVLRVSYSNVAADADRIRHIYYSEQAHDSLASLLQKAVTVASKRGCFMQVTTYSKLLSREDVNNITVQLNQVAIAEVKVVMDLQAIETEEKFTSEIRAFYGGRRQKQGGDAAESSKNALLIVQCEAGHNNLDLIACARFIIWREYNETAAVRDGSSAAGFFSRAQTTGTRHHVVLVIQLNQMSPFSGFHGGEWQCVHVDDLRPRKNTLPAIHSALQTTVSKLLETGLTSANCPREENAQPNAGDGKYYTDLLSHCKDQPTFDVFELLRACLHEAASCLRDPAAACERSTQRLQLLNDLFSRKGNKTFQRLFVICLVESLRQREAEHMTRDSAENWLNNAAVAQHVSWSGTFRRRLEDCLEKKLAPIFAAIVAYCDTNWNLDILNPKATHYRLWACEIWLQVLKSLSASTSDLMLAIKNTMADFVFTHENVQQRAEVHVTCKSANARTFTPKFPFSWLLKQKLDAVLEQTQSSQDVYAVMDTLLNSDTEIGCHLPKLTKEELEDATECYASDFVYMSHKCSSEQEHKVVDSILKAVMQRRNLNTIPGIHICYAQLKPRFLRLVRILEVTPPALKEAVIGSLAAEMPSHGPGDIEIVVDVTALHAVLRSLEHSLSSAASAKDWPITIQRCHTLVEEILTSKENTDAIVSQHSTAIRECRQMWGRLSAVRLFVEYTVLREPFSSSNRRVFEMKHAKVMFEDLSQDKGLSFKTLSSVQSLEKFLSWCNTQVISAVYGKSATKTICFLCDTTMGDPILLPCRHVICANCLQIQFQLNSESMACPECKQQIPFGYSYSPTDENERKSHQLHQSYKHCFNALLLRILSDLVFDDGDRPETLLVEHVLSYVTLETAQGQGSAAVGHTKPVTKQMSPYTDTTLIDPTPVIRSSLLQMLLRSSKGIVDESITKYFQRSLAVNRQSSNPADLELCILFINCMEDYDTKLLGPSHDVDQPVSVRAQEYALSRLRRGGLAWHIFGGQPLALSASSLSTVAMLRLSLVICADVICKIVLPEAAHQRTPASARELLEAMQQLLDHSERQGGCTWPRKFLAKQMIRKHGASSINAALKERSLVRIMPKEVLDAAARELLPDLFVIGNDSEAYDALRNALASSVVDGRVDAFDKHLQTMREPGSARNAMVLLAVCSVITRTYYATEKAIRPSHEVINMLVNYVRQCPSIDHKELCVQLLSNSLPGRLALTRDSGLGPALVALLITRLWIVLQCRNPQPLTILSPLVSLVKRPRSMQGTFFPTMPHDHFQDVVNVIQGLRTQQENLVAHECPNGHIYYIGNCGRANVQSTCPECTAPIGGTQHVLVPGNRVANPRGDQTRPGHILGPVSAAARQPAVPVAERDLSPVACSIVRVLLHMTLYASAAANGPAEVAPLIQPVPSDVLDFIWKHIVNDLDTLRQALGLSLDECVMFLHAVVANFSEAPVRENISWNTHGNRRTWEERLQSTCIARAVKDCKSLISAGHKSVQKDELQAGRAMALAHILEEPEEPADLGSLLSNTAVWRYRESPSIEHFVMQFENHCSTVSRPIDGSQGSIDTSVCLQKFLRSRVVLAAIHHLPAIISLAMLLHEEFSRKLDTVMVNSLTIEKFLVTRGRDCSLPLRPLIQSFIDAWNIVRRQLMTHRFWFHGRESQAPEATCATVISFDSPLRLLLPGSRGLALCPAALATYLAKCHNDFITVYAQACKEQPGPAISILDVQHIHLITADPDKDLLPIILANCEYSLKVGEGTHIQYNFDAIQLQMMDRFVRHKPPLSLPGARRSQAEIPKFLLREDVTNGDQLEKLAKILSQSMLPVDMKESICREYRGQIMDLSDSLVLIDRVIGFLVTAHRPPDSSLWAYMDETLGMPAVAHARTILKHCHLRHVRALWLLLSLERTKVLVRNHQSKWRSKDKSRSLHVLEPPERFPWQDWFSGVKDCYAQPLPEASQSDQGQGSFVRLCHEQVCGPVLDVLYELLVLRLSRGALSNAAEDEDDAYQPHYPLFYTLKEYVAAEYGDQGELWQSDGAAFAHLERLSTECAELQLQHVVAVWLLLFDMSHNATRGSKDTKGKAVFK